MKQNILLVEPSDFEETDEDYKILGIENLNNSSALFIICNNKTILIHLSCFSSSELSKAKLILEELIKSKFDIHNIELYIGSNCNTTNIEEFINMLPFQVKKSKPFIDENGNESIAYNEESKSMFGIVKMKHKVFLIEYISSQNPTLCLAM